MAYLYDGSNFPAFIHRTTWRQSISYLFLPPVLKPLIKSDNKTNKQKRSCEFFSLAVNMQLLEIQIKN